MQVVTGDILTNYELTGSGPLVIWLHGWGDSIVSSTAIRKELAQNYQVLAPDLPGFGASETPRTAWDLDDYAKWLELLLAKLSLDEPYAIIGHSNGGALAIHELATGSLKPQKLVLLAAAGIRTGQGSARKTGLKVLAKTGKVATAALPVKTREKLRETLYQKAGSDLLVAPHMQETFKKIVAQDVQADAAAITQPTLLLYGETDTATPPEMGQTYHELIKNSELHIVSDAGHFVYLDQTERVVKVVEDFLQ